MERSNWSCYLNRLSENLLLHVPRAAPPPPRPPPPSAPSSAAREPCPPSSCHHSLELLLSILFYLSPCVFLLLSLSAYPILYCRHWVFLGFAMPLAYNLCSISWLKWQKCFGLCKFFHSPELSCFDYRSLACLLLSILWRIAKWPSVSILVGKSIIWLMLSYFTINAVV